MGELYVLIKELLDGKFTGYIQINFFQGGVTNVIKNESIKLNK